MTIRPNSTLETFITKLRQQFASDRSWSQEYILHGLRQTEATIQREA
jgi:hypothetical protein